MNSASSCACASTIALALVVVGASFSVGCMDTQTASLGVEARRASDASAAGGRDAARDASEDSLPPDDGTSVGDDDAARDAAVRSAELDSGSSGASATEAEAGASNLDAGLAPSSASDAGAADGSLSHPDDHGGTHQDAKVPVNPLCIAEPWHCT